MHAYRNPCVFARRADALQNKTDNGLAVGVNKHGDPVSSHGVELHRDQNPEVPPCESTVSL